MSLPSSITAKAKTVPLEFVLPSFLSVVSVVDILSPSALTVCSDIIKNFAADVSMNVITDYANITNDIAMVVEEIVDDDGYKAVESDIIADMVEDAVVEAVGQINVEMTMGMQ